MGSAGKTDRGRRRVTQKRLVVAALAVGELTKSGSVRARAAPDFRVLRLRSHAPPSAT